ncbi:hypothetical protein HAX54_022736, partial [Datura stramonium]|nr:hypothetical protein [Datura stramonium]
PVARHPPLTSGHDPQQAIGHGIGRGRGFWIQGNPEIDFMLWAVDGTEEALRYS